MKNIKIFGMFACLMLIGFIVLPEQAHAQPAQTVHDGVASLSFIRDVFEVLLKIMASLIGLGAMTMIMLGSFQWLISGGDQKKLQQAKATISYAVGGLMLIFGVWFVLYFIAGFSGNPRLLNFEFGIWN